MRHSKGFTLMELLIVIGVVVFLMAAIFAGAAHLRDSARRNKTKTLLEKVLNGLESYKLQYHAYPPDSYSSMTGNAALNFFMTTTFRNTPNTANGEVYSAVDMGPLLKFDTSETSKGLIIDAWGQPLHYERIAQEDLSKAQKLDVPPGYDPTRSMAAGERLLISSYVCKLYSFGLNRKDDGGNGDDLLPGKQ